MISFVSADGDFHVNGVIVNDGAYPFWQLQVKYDILDQQGVVLGVFTSILTDKYVIGEGLVLARGETTTFQAGFYNWPKAANRLVLWSRVKA
jgi:hypothetical protein